MKLTQKIVILLALVILLAAGILSYLTFRLSKSVLEQSIGITQLEIAEQTMDKIDRMFYERYGDIQQIANRRSLFEHLKDLTQGEDQDQKLKKELNELTVVTGPWDVLSLVTTEYQIHQSTFTGETDKTVSTSHETRPAVEAALTGEIYYSDFMISGVTGKPTLIFSAPVYDEENPSRPIIGAVVGYLSWPTIPEILEGIDAHGILLNENGKLIAENNYFSKFGLSSRVSEYREEKDTATGQVVKRTFIAGQSESSVGEEVFVAVSPQMGFLDFKGNNWSVVFELPTAVAFAPATRTALFLTGILIPILILVLGTVLILMIHFVVRPIQLLTATVQKFSGGDFSGEVKVNSSDEIGILASTFNEMAKRINNSYVNLEEKVKEKTGLLAHKVEEVEKQNKVLEDTKVAMMNVLEDTRELQEELQKQKEGVEKEVTLRTEQLNQEQARLEASINSLSFGFVMTDVNKNIVTMNETAKHLLGHPNTVALTREDVTRAFTIEDVSRYLFAAFDVKQEMETVMQKRVPAVREVTIGNFYLLIRITPIITIESSFQVIGSVIVVENITERKMLERSRDEFFSIASHELRTPLTAIRGNTALIQQFFGDKIQDPEFREMVDDIHQSSTRLIEIVNDFLNTSRLELGKMKFKLDIFSAPDLVGEVIKEYETTGSVKMLHLIMDPVQTELAPVRADRDKVKQVLINLVGNAIKFTEKGGINISLIADRGFVKVSVTDTGRGISEESQKLLFRKFQQAAESIYTRDATQGTGLGLYISRLMIEGMGGQIKLEHSEAGKGSTFSFWVPGSNGVDPVSEKAPGETLLQPLTSTKLDMSQGK